MRTNEDRILAMHRRAEDLEQEKKSRRALLAGAGSMAGCLVLVILLAVRMPQIAVSSAQSPVPGGMSASIFSANGALSYIVIAVVAFALGVSVTVFCYVLKKWRDRRGGGDNR